MSSHDPPCESLEEAKLQFAREITSIRRRRIKWAVWAPVIAVGLSMLTAIVTSLINNVISKKAAEVAEITASQTCQKMIVAQSATFLLGAQVGKQEAEAEARKAAEANPPPINRKPPVIKP